jgi:hypothetical protein
MSRMKWHRVRTRADGVGAEDSENFAVRGEIELALGRRGVSLEKCESLARAIEPKLRGLDDEESDRVLDGVAFALVDYFEAKSDSGHATGAERVEARLFRDFAREIQKLDETVKVLSAYLQRLNAPKGRNKVRRLQ